ncbi:PREDICTED: reticulon-like protein B17 isoform X2 [Populus euphratica]|uniref:Reticulon-like protein n=1 Tax=Populus euphratica TaxID=75702 RepID=A0AAJ6UFK5_POPEU|nr:PREDICTED: reticulon-like protein B17 isoform X2 [Populus euphratica]
MDTTPPSRRSNPNSQAKSASRLSRIIYSIEPEAKPPQLSLDLIPSSEKKTPSSLSLKSSTNSLPLQEQLLLSPSPLRKSRNRLVDRYEIPEEGVLERNGYRRRCKGRGSQMGSLGCASPRSDRRLRRRLEVESREERDLIGFVDEVGKLRKRRHSGRSKKEKEKLSLVPSLPSSSTTPIDEGDGGNLERIGMVVYDLITWKDVAKSSLWFGLGCLCFLSSCFAKGISFSILSAISQLGLLFLGVSFLSNSICQRNSVEKLRKFKLTEEDILRVGRLILPAANLAISKTRELFSGEPSMTLKVIPFLLLGAEYGHLVTLRRLCGIGFFISFTIPKLFACYSSQINQKAEHLKCRMMEAWRACSHKKMVAASAVTAFWNLSSLKTRIFTAFISLVILRCCRQQQMPSQEEGGLPPTQVEGVAEGEQEPQQAGVAVASLNQ